MEDDLTIPDFLRVENRKPLTEEEQARVKAFMKKARKIAKDNIPSTQRPKHWDATCEKLYQQIEKEKKEKQAERFKLLRERHGKAT